MAGKDGKVTEAAKAKIKEYSGYLERQHKMEIIPSNFIKCNVCGKIKTVNDGGNFYQSESKLHAGCTAIYTSPTKDVSLKSYAPVCKGCLGVKLGDASSLSHLVECLQLLDKPYFESDWNKTVDMWAHRAKPISVLGKYSQTLSLNHKEKRFSDSDNTSDREEVFFDGQEVKLSKAAEKKLMATWGEGLTAYEYNFLDNEKYKIESSFENNDYGMNWIIEEVAWTALKIDKRKKDSKDYADLTTQMGKLMNDGSMKPVQSTGANAQEALTYGLLIKKFENERPTPDPDPLWADVDGIKFYIRVWFLGHLCALLGIKNAYSEEYYEELAKYTVDVVDDEESEFDDSEFDETDDIDDIDDEISNFDNIIDDDVDESGGEDE